MTAKHLGLLALALGLLALPGCSLFGGDDDKTSKPEKEKAEEPVKTTPICPQVAIVRELDTLRDYGHEKPAPNQLVAEAHMQSINGNCAYRDNGIDITFDLNIVAARGPRLGGLHAELPFFVAVVDPDGTVLNKNLLTAEIGFSSDDPVANDAESLHVFIPLAKGRRETGPSYQVLAGFQLTQEQLDATTPK